MAPQPSPVRAQAAAFIASEIARVGSDGLDVPAIVRRFVALGVSKSRVHAWVADARLDASPAKKEANAAREAAQAKTEAAHTAAMIEAEMQAVELAVLPPAPSVAAFAALVAESLLDPRATLDVHPPAYSHGGGPADETGKVADDSRVDAAAPATAAAGGDVVALSLVPDAAKGVLAHLQTIMDTALRVLAFSHTPDGKVRNPKLALSSGETLRRCLETAAKLYESINNTAQVERFMAEVVAELHLASPDMARRVVERMRVVQSRWSH